MAHDAPALVIFGLLMLAVSRVLAWRCCDPRWISSGAPGFVCCSLCTKIRSPVLCQILTRVSLQEKEAAPVIKANPMPHYGVPFKPKMPEQRHVEVCPFSFDARDKERQMQKEKRIEELQKEEVRATPCLGSHPSEGRGRACLLLWAVKISKLHLLEERARNILCCFSQVPKFKALPLPYFDQVKLPEKKVKAPTQPEPFNLQVDERGAAKLQNWKQQVG